MATVKKRGDSFLITVYCGMVNGDKTRKTKTVKPDLFYKNGKPIEESARRKKAEKLAQEFEVEVKNGTYTDGCKMTFEKYSEKYLKEYAEKRLAPTSLVSTRSAIKVFNKDFGYKKLTDISPLFLQEYANRMIGSPRLDGKPGTLSANTVKRKFSVLSSMFSKAKKWKLIKDNPAEGIEFTEEHKPKKDDSVPCFTLEETAKFLEIIKNPMVYDYHKADGKTYQEKHKIPSQLQLFFNLAIYAGCRRGELIALEWSDIDFDNDTISIWKSTTRANGEVITKEPKTESSVRIIDIPPEVADMAKAWKIEQLEYRFQIGSKWEGNNYVFIQWNGRQMNLDTPYHAFKRIIDNYNDHRKPEEIPLPQIPLHGLRHTHITLLVASNKLDIKTISKDAGHSSIQTTLKTYSHALRKQTKKVPGILTDTIQNQG